MKLLSEVLPHPLIWSLSPACSYSLGGANRIGFTVSSVMNACTIRSVPLNDEKFNLHTSESDGKGEFDECYIVTHVPRHPVRVNDVFVCLQVNASELVRWVRVNIMGPQHHFDSASTVNTVCVNNVRRLRYTSLGTDVNTYELPWARTSPR